MSYPILLDLRERCVVVVGGGAVAARKVTDLLGAGAQITVISPTLHPNLAALGDRIEVHQIGYAAGMLTNMIQWDMNLLLVFAATDSREVNDLVVEEAHSLNILVSAADDGDADGGSDFTSMATIRRGEITIAMATGGASPALAAHLRAKIGTEIGEEYATLAGWLGELRPLVRAEVASETGRRDLWRAILNSPVLDRLRAGDDAGARAMIDASVEQAIAESE